MGTLRLGSSAANLTVSETYRAQNQRPGNKEFVEMIDLSIFDSHGNPLVLTTRVTAYSFDAVTCSPHPDGFTVLNSLLGRSVPRTQLEVACNEAVARNDVFIFPREVSPKRRILLTPTLHSIDSASRLDASRLMNSLFSASQEQKVKAKQLLITHFAHVTKYPEPHIQGIFDALKYLMSDSFHDLKVLGFWISEKHMARFERHLSGIFVG